jgi:hypothetical protein
MLGNFVLKGILDNLLTDTSQCYQTGTLLAEVTLTCAVPYCANTTCNLVYKASITRMVGRLFVSLNEVLRTISHPNCRID